MRRVRSKLSDSGTSVLALAGVNLVLLLCLCVLLNTHRTPKYGLNVCPAESHFVFSQFNRSHTHVLTITPGEEPRLFIEGDEIRGGMRGLEKLLKTWDDGHPSRVSVILVCDASVSTGVLQYVTDRILSHGFNCALSGRPAKD